MDRKQLGHDFRIKCIKYLLISINVLYLVISCLMMSGGAALKVMFGEFYMVLWDSKPIDSLSSLWIATGCLLLALSIFGIAAAIKESTILTNIYGIFLSLVFILQMAAAITGFTLISPSSILNVRKTLHTLMYLHQYHHHYRNAMNWVQSTFECCGIVRPSDWNDYGQWWATPIYSESGTTTMELQQNNKMPESCCTVGSGYENMICDYHFTRGCDYPLLDVISVSAKTIGSSALIIGVVEILGVICAFLLARAIRRNKTNRDMQRWKIHQSMGFDEPDSVCK